MNVSVVSVRSLGRRVALGAVAAAALLTAAVPAQAADGEATKTIELKMGMGEILRPIDRTECPSGMKLSTKRYGEMRWAIPLGVDILQEKPNGSFEAKITAFQRDGERVGIGGDGLKSTVSNWVGAAQTVTIVLHCVS